GSDALSSPVSYTMVCPDCMPVTNITISDVTVTTASISWVSGNSAWQYQLNEDEVFTVNERPVELTGLTANTQYTIKIRAICGEDEYSEWAIQTFSTACEAIVTFPWTETFESLTTPEMPSCWTVIDANNDGDYWKTFTDYGNPGISVGLYTDYNNGSNNDYLILPAFELNGSYVFSYDVRARSTSEPNDYRVLLSTTGNSPEDFTVVLKELETVDYTTYQTKDINLNGYNGMVYIAIHVPQGGLDGYYIYFDNFKIRETSSAAEITAFSFAEDAEVAVIDSENARVTSVVSYQTESLNGLVPTIAISDYATIAPASGVAQDFTGPVTYTVTAEDGTTTKEWTVNVSKVETASSAKDILSFTFSGQSREADINPENHTVLAYAAWNYDFANNITPTITVSPQATIYPVSDSAINFATPVTYTVTAEDESTQEWTVTIINDPNACVNPLPATFVVSDLTSSTATVAWERRYTETSYNVKVSTTSISVSDIATTDGDFYNGVVNDTVIALTGLAENTLYYVYVQSACGIETWTSYSFRTIVSPATIPYVYAFEDATENNNWVLINGEQTNKWYIGTVSSNSGNGLYISNDNGTTNAYTTGSLAFAYAYRTISMETGDYVISYNWKAQGESQYYDYLRAWLAPASFAFTPGQAPDGGTSVYNYATGNNPSGWISLDESHSLNQVSSWQSQTLTASVSAGTYNLVFMWANDGGGGSQPPASVDNISVTKITCPVVADIETDNIT
ncbi:MAG: choice-of-anchor J domain-containing protein, partial [Bacteroidales bacterium]|nr:choice-of-anchor J domain-containing protein [Bacteroidales bacterium]